MKQLHIEIPWDSYIKLKDIAPSKGMITHLIRRFIQRYISYYEESPTNPSPIDKIAEELSNETKRRG